MKLFKGTIADLTAKPYMWCHTSDPEFFMMSAFKQDDAYASRRWLTELDPRLPMALDYIIKTTKAPQMLAGRVLSTLTYWNHPRPVLKGENTVDAKTYIIGARNAVISSMNENNVTANLITVEVELVDGVPIALGPSTPVIMDLNADWLEDKFPHGVARMKAGIALNMAPRELASYIFDFEESKTVISELPTNMV